MPGAPQTVTPRTAEQQAQDMQHGGRVAAHQHPPTGAHAQSRQCKLHIYYSYYYIKYIHSYINYYCCNCPRFTMITVMYRECTGILEEI